MSESETEQPRTDHGEPFPGETLIADGWEYRDLPRMTPEFFDEFVGIVGSENIRWLTMASYSDGAKRGQLLVSPTGLANCVAYSKARRPQRGRSHEPTNSDR